MTREEAKEALSVLKIYDNQWLREAIDMAIEALSQESSEDVISRQAAIDRAVSIPMFGRDVKMVAVSEIKNLPPAQPELAQDLPNACTDAISRQAAIDALQGRK